EIQAVCSRVLVLNEGRLIADNTPQELASLIHGTQSVSVRVLGGRAEAESALRAAPGIAGVDFMGQREAGSHDFLVGGGAGRDVRADAFRALATAGLAALRITGEELSLEETFHILLRRDRERGA
ncbi:MAG TPA: hypothetical protein VLA21_05310, partial [Candidatus Limnocylindria bacterium]|nr:hypothetical protein [Candidatus Limnocylindria bacterium]